MLIRAAHKQDSTAIWAIPQPAIQSGETYALDPDMSERDALAYWLGPDKETFVAEGACRLSGVARQRIVQRDEKSQQEKNANLYGYAIARKQLLRQFQCKFFSKTARARFIALENANAFDRHSCLRASKTFCGHLDRYVTSGKYGFSRFGAGCHWRNYRLELPQSLPAKQRVLAKWCTSNECWHAAKSRAQVACACAVTC
jgi:hypothetical protein